MYAVAVDVIAEDAMETRYSGPSTARRAARAVAECSLVFSTAPLRTLELASARLDIVLAAGASVALGGAAAPVAAFLHVLGHPFQRFRLESEQYLPESLQIILAWTTRSFTSQG